MNIHRQSVPDYILQRKEHQDKTHIVVPVVMMVEGVHNGSGGPLLHKAEFLGANPSVWNGIPVVIGHPQRDGSFVSANSPDVVDAEAVGRVYNAYFEDGKMKGEVWLDEEKLTAQSAETLAYITGGKALDVSIGVFTDDEKISGTWNGVDYTGIAKNHKPDHLALLPGQEGACNWADGCGIRANQKGGDKMLVANALKYRGVKREWTQEELTSLETPEMLRIVGYAQGFDETMSAIWRKLNAMDTDTKFYSLEEVFSNYFVYRVSSRDAEISDSLFKSTYTMKQDGEVDFTGDPQKVLKKVEYVVQSKDGGTKDVKRTTPCGCQVAPEDETPDVNTKKKEPEVKPAEPIVPKQVESPQINEAQLATAIGTYFKSNPDAYLTFAPPEIKGSLEHGLQLHEAERGCLIQHIVTNQKTPVYTAEGLASWETKALENLASVIQTPVNHALMQAPNPVVNTERVPMIPGGIMDDGGTK